MRFRRFLRLLLLSMLGLSVLLSYNWLPFLSPVPTAAAKSFVIGSDPVDGSTVTTVPTVMRITFNEDISPASIAHIYFAPNGQLMDGGRSVVSTSNPRELDTPLLPPKQLQPGSYIVRWTALSSVDGQATQGVIGFNIGQSSLGLSGEVILGPSTSNILPQLDMQGMLTVAWDWLVMAALMLWLGILVGEGLILGMGAGREGNGRLLLALRKKSLPLQWLCLTALLFGEIINLILRVTGFNQLQGSGGIHLGMVVQILVETNYGHFWLARIIFIGLALGFLWWTTHRQPDTVSANVLSTGTRPARTKNFSQLRQQAAMSLASTKGASSSPGSAATTSLPGESPLADARDSAVSVREIPQWQTITWLILAGLILLTLALSGDAAAQAQPQPNTVVLNWIFLVTQGMGLGSIAYLAFVVLPHLPTIEPDHYGESLVTLLRQYTPVLIGTAGVALLCGIFLGETAIGDVQQFLSDPYGRALLIKIALVIIMLILTGYALYYLLPRLARQVALLPVVNAELPARRTRQSALGQTRRRLKRALTIVACLGAAVLLCAALMSFFAPPIVFPNLHYNQNAGSPVGPPAAQTKSAGNLSVTLQVTPAHVDETNTVMITLKDSSGKPVTDAKVQLTTNMEIMDMGTTSKSISAGKPAYSATFASGEGFDMQGIWDIFVRIQRPGQQPVQLQFQVMVT